MRPRRARHTQISNDASENISHAHIKQLVFQAHGQERTDPSWIAKPYRPECKREATENRVCSTPNARGRPQRTGCVAPRMPAGSHG
eukprot:264770-Chlamydomonas_euryale.AAC.4